MRRSALEWVLIVLLVIFGGPLLLAFIIIGSQGKSEG